MKQGYGFYKISSLMDFLLLLSFCLETLGKIRLESQLDSLMFNVAKPFFFHTLAAPLAPGRLAVGTDGT
jgi:hypothetical protein